MEIQGILLPWQWHTIQKQNKEAPMQEDVIRLGGGRKSRFMDKVMEILPEGGNLNLCLTCGACSSG
jgi:hypothetical protein